MTGRVGEGGAKGVKGLSQALTVASQGRTIAGGDVRPQRAIANVWMLWGAVGTHPVSQSDAAGGGRGVGALAGWAATAMHAAHVPAPTAA